MRKITDHKLNGLNDAIEVEAIDDPGAGGANHLYLLFIPDSVPLKSGVTVHQHLSFQNGPIAEDGFNGISNEALLAVLIDRMRGFQGHNEPTQAGLHNKPSAPFACRENAIALTHLEAALMWLQKRTRGRLVRGVEGTHQK